MTCVWVLPRVGLPTQGLLLPYIYTYICTHTYKYIKIYVDCGIGQLKVSPGTFSFAVTLVLLHHERNKIPEGETAWQKRTLFSVVA